MIQNIGSLVPPVNPSRDHCTNPWIRHPDHCDTTLIPQTATCGELCTVMLTDTRVTQPRLGSIQTLRVVCLLFTVLCKHPRGGGRHGENHDPFSTARIHSHCRLGQVTLWGAWFTLDTHCSWSLQVLVNGSCVTGWTKFPLACVRRCVCMCVYEGVFKRDCCSAFSETWRLLRASKFLMQATN